MNIGVDLRCLQNSERTGVGEYAFELITNILKQDRTNRYFLFFNSAGNLRDIPVFNFPNVSVAKFNFPNKLFNFCSLFFGYPKIDRLIAKKFQIEKLDIFYSPNLNFVSLSKDIKKFITIHDLTFELFPKFLTLKQRLWHRLAGAKKQCQDATKIFVPSENTKADIIKYFSLPQEKIAVIYPGISSVFSNKSAAGGGEFNFPSNYILFLGTIEPRKNLTALITAFENICKERNDIDLVIAGGKGWKNKNLFKTAASSPASNRIHFVGYIPETNKPEVYRKAFAFVYPSIYEGFGLPVLEAMYSGVPVITSDRSSLSEITGNAGILIDPRRPEEIADAIRDLWRDPNFYKKLSDTGRAMVNKFSWEKAATEWLEAIK